MPARAVGWPITTLRFLIYLDPPTHASVGRLIPTLAALDRARFHAIDVWGDMPFDHSPSAGTTEFLVDAEQHFYFMEMNTRVQVEHPVTEVVSGMDIVREQIRVASGEPMELTGLQKSAGHAIEFRINAEDPRNDFLPRAGIVTKVILPGGPGVRVDTHLYEGYAVPRTVTPCWPR